MNEHKEQLDGIKSDILEIKEILKPIAESYAAAVKLGTWATKIIVFISVGIGIIASIRNFK